jgi:hypothetical protein
MSNRASSNATISRKNALRCDARGAARKDRRQAEARGQTRAEPRHRCPTGQARLHEPDHERPDPPARSGPTSPPSSKTPPQCVDRRSVRPMNLLQAVSLAILAEKRGPSAIATLFPKPTIQRQRLCSLGRVQSGGSSSPPLLVHGTYPQQESSRGAQPPLTLLRLLQKEPHLLAGLRSSKNSTQMVPDQRQQQIRA